MWYHQNCVEELKQFSNDEIQNIEFMCKECKEFNKKEKNNDNIDNNSNKFIITTSEKHCEIIDKDNQIKTTILNVNSKANTKVNENEYLNGYIKSKDPQQFSHNMELDNI